MGKFLVINYKTPGGPGKKQQWVVFVSGFNLVAEFPVNV
jgi:hypothetical protein